MAGFQTFSDPLIPRIVAAIEDAIDGSKAEVTGGGGHFSIRVVSKAFEGKSPVAKQRLVYKAITPLMSGPDAPLHAVDKLETIIPG